jgi:thiol-disulfide isomerase/thioredoxin
VAAAVVALSALSASCGGGGEQVDSAGSDAAASEPAPTQPATTEPATTEPAAAPATPVAPADPAAPATPADLATPGGSPAPVAPDVPEVAMRDVATGEATTLRAALTSDGRPVLAWFWAPHCPTCRGEAPDLDAFMAEHGDEVMMVGIGARDDLDLAEEFLERTGVENFPLLWDRSGESWRAFEVLAQPYLVLIEDGEVVERWPGGASPEEIAERLDLT